MKMEGNQRNHIPTYNIEHFETESPRTYTADCHTPEEKSILIQLADFLLEERLITAEEWMRLSKRIARE